MNKTRQKTVDNMADRTQLIDILLRNHLIEKDQLLDKKIDAKQINEMVFQLYNEQTLDSTQTQFLLEILSPIYATKEYHKKLIELSKRTMEITLKTINNRNYKQRKTEKEIKRIKRNLNNYWKAVQETDNNVMDRTNSLLKSLQVVGTDLESHDNSYRSRKKRKQIGCLCLYDNMGFSKDDGFSKNPFGKIDIFLQRELFSLIESLLDLHVRITNLFFCQMDFFRAIDSDSQTGNKEIYDFISESFQKVLPRKQCFKIIKEVLDNYGHIDYSESYILKQLSNWNTNKVIITKKGKKRGPLPGYEKARRGTDSDFEDWVKSTYLQYYINKKKKSSINQKNIGVYDEAKEYLDQDDDE